MNCPQCNSGIWIQVANGEERSLTFKQGNLVATSNWTRSRADRILSPNFSLAFICEKCRIQLIADGADQTLYFQLLHSAPAVNSGPGATLDRRRGSRDQYNTWIAQLRDQPFFGSVDADRCHFKIQEAKINPFELTQNPQYFFKGSCGPSVFVPHTWRAHVWLESTSSGRFPAQGELVYGQDYYAVAATTTARIVEGACHFQENFIRGAGPLSPLSAEQLEKIVGIDASTINRCKNAVRLDLPKGPAIYLKRLFPEAFGESNQTVDQVKNLLLELLSEVSPRLADRAMAERLATLGIQIARSTVAKYRTELENRSRLQQAIPIDFPDKEFARFQNESQLAGILRRAGIANFETLKHLDVASWTTLYAALEPELSDLIVRLSLQLQNLLTVRKPSQLLAA